MIGKEYCDRMEMQLAEWRGYRDAPDDRRNSEGLSFPKHASAAGEPAVTDRGY
jgi:hypothetical protein